jgi:hypothetical protein
LEDKIEMDMRDTVSEYMNLTQLVQNTVYWGGKGLNFADDDFSDSMTEHSSDK